MAEFTTEITHFHHLLGNSTRPPLGALPLNPGGATAANPYPPTTKSWIRHWKWLCRVRILTETKHHVTWQLQFSLHLEALAFFYQTFHGTFLLLYGFWRKFRSTKLSTLTSQRMRLRKAYLRQTSCLQWHESRDSCSHCRLPLYHLITTVTTDFST